MTDFDVVGQIIVGTVLHETWYNGLIVRAGVCHFMIFTICTSIQLNDSLSLSSKPTSQPALELMAIEMK